MKVLGIQGSPRKKGNSDILLDKCIEGARAAGAEVEILRPSAMKISGCLECGGCDETGECVVKDGMQDVYPLLDQAQRIVLAAPIFFYSFPAQVKALIDRAQARWSKRRLLKSPLERKTYQGGYGYLIGVGATRGKNLFEGVELVTRYFYDALDMEYCSGLLVRHADAKGAVLQQPEVLAQAFQLGKHIVGTDGCASVSDPLES